MKPKRFGYALIVAAAVWQPATAGAAFAPVAAQAAESAAASELVAAARERTRHVVLYDGTYQSIDYPMGDVAPGRGVCTDVIIRSYRAGLAIDLQRLVHEDMRKYFDLYPKRWGLSRPDRNIDHRRVPNLQVFFRRHGQSLPLTGEPGDFQPGDLVTWMLPGNLPHIGIVSERRTADGLRPLIIHNIGAGPREEDALYVGDITGHYRYLPSPTEQSR